MEEDAMTCQVQGDSKEAVAFGLMQCVLFAAGRANNEHPFPAGSTLLRGQGACTEGEILALYARCLKVVQGAEPMAEHLATRPELAAAQLHS
jgi:hypothetical protein